MNLLNPVTYRFKPAHEAHLRRRAKTDGHGNKAIILRQLIEQDMRARAKRPHHKSRAA